MDEFNQAAENQMVAAGVAAEPGAEQHKERPDPFAAAAQNMRRDRIDQRDAGIEIFPDLLFDPRELVTIGLPHVGHRVQRKRARSIRHAADSRAGCAGKSSKTRA